MKRFLLWLVVASVFAQLGSTWKSEYRWVRATMIGSGRDEDRWERGTWPNVHVQPVVLNDTLIIIGARHTWKSADGVQWKMFRHDGGWGTRYGAAMCVFKGRIWMMGGMRTWDKFCNDVWLSEDGLRWRQVTAAAPWSQRRGHVALILRRTLWIVGGAESSGVPDVLPRESLGDVWNTEDGETWHCVTREAPWKAGFSKAFFSTSMSAHVLREQLWVLGGPTGNGVWSSADGRAWTCETDHSSWSPRFGRGSAVFDGLIWLFGGPDLNDVWNSADGRHWRPMEKAPWSPRAPGNSVVYLDRLWLFGGKTGKSGQGSWGDDVWFLTSLGSGQ